MSHQSQFAPAAPDPRNPPPHFLNAEATTCLLNARSLLLDMAVDCMNRDTPGHRRDIVGVQAWLHLARKLPIGTSARKAIERVCVELSALRAMVPRLARDQIGNRYNLAEMRLAAIMINDIDYGHRQEVTEAA